MTNKPQTTDSLQEVPARGGVATRVFKFKATGGAVQDRTPKRSQSPEPLGPITPLQYGFAEYELPFAMHTVVSEQISDNLRRGLLTNWGERLGNYRYGANLRPLLFELNTDEGVEELGARIQNFVQSYFPGIYLTEYDVRPIPNDSGVPSEYIVQIKWSLPDIETQIYTTEITLHNG